jgi:carbon storage regulator
MLVLTRKNGETIFIGDAIQLTIMEIKGDQVKLGIQAPANVKVYRQEVYQAIQEENRLAAKNSCPTLPNLPGFGRTDS